MDALLETRRLVTVADVAREAGVGLSTAARVLRRQGSYSKAAGERVMEAAAKLGYVPNRLAGSLAGGTTPGAQLVGVIVPSLANIVFPELLRGLTSTLDVAGYQSVIGVSDYDPDHEQAIVEALLSWRPAALAVAGLEHTDATRAMIQASGVRVVEMVDLDGDGLDIVIGYSNVEAGRASARHLVRRGYRRIGYVGHDIGRDLRAAKRLAGFEAALAETGMSLLDREIAPGPSSASAGRAALSRLMARAPDLDAVYFSNDDMALGGYFHCLAAGVAAPSQLALFGFNGLEIADALPQRLSTIRTPRFEIGRMTAERLASGGASEVVDLGFELIEGETA